MARYRNASGETIYFRDDRPDKQEIAPGESFDVVGDQHVPYVTSLPGVEDATVEELLVTADVASIPIRRGARKAEIVDAIDSSPDAPAE